MTDYEGMTDEQLVVACRSGDEIAWETVISRYERLVYTIPARYGLTPAEIDDVFQSVWLSLLKNLDRLREPDRISFRHLIGKQLPVAHRSFHCNLSF